jgi:hypothetical protein
MMTNRMLGKDAVRAGCLVERGDVADLSVAAWVRLAMQKTTRAADKSLVQRLMSFSRWLD